MVRLQQHPIPNFALLQGSHTEQSGVDEAHVLCMTEAPHAGSEGALALWAWLRMHIALGMLEAWASSEDPRVLACPQYIPTREDLNPPYIFVLTEGCFLGKRPEAEEETWSRSLAHCCALAGCW